ncbi:MAG: YggS family pyridoxal phosphate-dependent enzyme [Alphaproteobacteria bacterium]|nr:YggS family pyridoxal phosphate-dependent enzyme [Alphaproteobacteria bacterium]
MQSDSAPRVAESYSRLVDAIAEAAEAAGREAAEITLVAVSKTRPAEYILPVLSAGHIDFGENRVQEAQQKWPDLKARFPAARLHLIGPLQSNKARDAVALADAIHSLDREKLIRAVSEEMARSGRAPECFIQVNTGEEAQKSGVPPGQADALIEVCREKYALPLVGLMCLPPLDEEPAPHFALLRKIAERHGLTKLSMGMTADYRTAIALGATHIRVGSAIFGARQG